MDNNLNNSTGMAIVIFIGLIKDKVKAAPHLYEFTCIWGFVTQFYNGYINTDIFRNYDAIFYYPVKIGIFSNHIICAIFFEYMPPSF